MFNKKKRPRSYEELKALIDKAAPNTSIPMTAAEIELYRWAKADESGRLMGAVTQEPALLTTLREWRTNAVRQANALDARISALDEEITYLERHPGSDAVLKEFLNNERDAS